MDCRSGAGDERRTRDPLLGLVDVIELALTTSYLAGYYRPPAATR